MGLDSGSDVSGTCVEAAIAALDRGLNLVMVCSSYVPTSKLID